MLQWVSDEGLKPPVALLCYQPDDPQRSVFYPFADFSPEWQAILYARRQNIHVRFMDLPAGNQMLVEKEQQLKQETPPEPGNINHDALLYEQIQINKSPISFLSDAAGF